MVKQRRTHIRPSAKYFDFSESIRRELEPKLKRRLSDREITGSIIDFMDDEKLTPIFLKQKKRRGWRFH